MFVLYALITSLRALEEKDFAWNNGPAGKDFGKKLRLAIFNLVSGMHLVKGFSMNVSTYL